MTAQPPLSPPKPPIETLAEAVAEAQAAIRLILDIAANGLEPQCEQAKADLDDLRVMCTLPTPPE